jgi:pimeloyl-ACP methyl ester carboxylesterase
VSGERQDIESPAGRLALFSAGHAHAPSGAPVLLIHSINAAGSAYEVKPIFEHVAQGRLVYALELPGFGHSQRGPRAYTVRLMTDAIHAAVDHIRTKHGVAPVDALAVSLSCEFLARAISEAPAAFRSAVLVSPTGFMGKPRAGSRDGTRAMPWLHSLFEMPLWSRGLWNVLVSQRSINFFLAKTWGSKNYDRGLAAYDYLTTHQPGARHAPFYFVSGYLFSTGILDIYRELTLPVWMVHGTRGDFTDYSAKTAVQERPNWRIDVMDAGAMPYFERPADFFAQYDAFLGRVAARESV